MKSGRRNTINFKRNIDHWQEGLMPRSRYGRRVMDYYVPEETEELLRKRAHKCKNLGLLLDKYIPISVFEKPDKNDKNKGKTPWLARILEPTNPKDKGKEQNKHLDAE